jgi:hypothetical protein
MVLPLSLRLLLQLVEPVIQQPKGADHDGSVISDADSSDIDSVLPAESDSETVEQAHMDLTGAFSSGSSSFPEISDSEDDPSRALPQDFRLRALRIHQGPHQPILSKYEVTIHRGKARSFSSKWCEFHDGLEYSPKIDRMFCFVCRAFAHKDKVIGSVGRVEFTTSGTQGSCWKDARKVLSS